MIVVNCKSRKVTVLSEMVRVCLIDALNFLSKLVKHCGFFQNTKQLQRFCQYIVYIILVFILCLK